MPKKEGQIDIFNPKLNKDDFAGTVSVLENIWRNLAKRYSEGRERAVFAFRPSVKNAGDADRLRRDLERRHGKEAVADALAALLGRAPYLTIENEKRRAEFLAEVHLQAYEKRGLVTAATRGSALGMYLMAECSAKGIGTRPSESVARQWYQKAAAAEYPLAQQWCEQNSVSYASSETQPTTRRIR